MPMLRYAIVNNATVGTVSAYLPANYSVLHTFLNERGNESCVIYGRDNAGWTLDHYVIPRLASGLYHCCEIDLSHPIMKAVI